jgi:peptidoglycan hydrolase-like protein with peptidoglycan-binding domain
MKSTLIAMLATAALSLPALAQQQNHPANNTGTQQQQTQNNQPQNQPKQNQQGQNQPKENQQGQKGQSATAPMRMGKSEVRHIQQKLDRQGFRAGREDGMIGPETTAALRDFQKKKGLQVTGQADQRTLRALGVSMSGQNRPGYASSKKGTSAQGTSGQGQPGANKSH